MKIKYVEAMIGGDRGRDPEVVSVTMPDLEFEFEKTVNAVLADYLPDLDSDIKAHIVDDIVADCGEIIENKQDSARVDFDEGEVPSFFRSLGTIESVERQLGNAFINAELVAIVGLDDLQKLIALAESRSAA